MKVTQLIHLSATVLWSSLLSAKTLYINGRILTVDADNRIVEAVAVHKGTILAVGSNEDILSLQQHASGATVIDLQGRTMVPGFIDGHSHFMDFSGNAGVPLGSPPMGPVKDIAGLIDRLRLFQQEKQLAPNEWLLGFGYDHDQLAEARHPHRDDLDKAFPNTPVFIYNVNGHMGVANSFALALSRINKDTADPPGGTIVREPITQELTGLLQENAQSMLAIPVNPARSLADQLADLDDRQLLYASQGITTAQDGFTSISSLELLQQAADSGRLIIDIEALPAAHHLDDILSGQKWVFGKMENRLKLAGVKQIADGSPQGKTAYFSAPYLTAVPGCQHGACTGFPTIDQEQFNAFVTKTFRHGIRPFVHCNGDATVDMYLKAMEHANEVLDVESVSLRPVTIHAQFVRLDQLDRFKKLGVIPAFFSNHAFFWGDVHIQNLGRGRAGFLSPLKSAAARGIIATNHTDYPVTPLNQLFLIWTAVKRETRSGQIVGSSERLTSMEALRAVTINGAYQYQEEDLKGSIEPGKLADLVILSADISTIDVDDIKSVEVLETIKEGMTIYRK